MFFNDSCLKEMSTLMLNDLATLLKDRGPRRTMIIASLPETIALERVEKISWSFERASFSTNAQDLFLFHNRTLAGNTTLFQTA